MNLPRIFRRTRPTPPPRLDPQEARVIAAWGFTEAEWSSMTWESRAHFRTNYLKAPRRT